MKKDKVIGVIGGMGPAAGLDLVKKITDYTLAHSDHAHLPVALLSYPERIPDRSTFLFGKSDDNPAVAMAEIALQLEHVGAVVAGIPCNTAHAPAIYDTMLDILHRGGSRLQMLHMLEETARMLEESGKHVSRVGLLSTTAVYRLRMYEMTLQKAGWETVIPDENVQEELVNPTIFDGTWGVKGISNPVSDRARQSLIAAIDHLGDKGADAVVLGCTELPLVIPETEINGLTVIDPTVALARALIRETYPEYLRPM